MNPNVAPQLPNQAHAALVDALTRRALDMEPNPDTEAYIEGLSTETVIALGSRLVGNTTQLCDERDTQELMQPDVPLGRNPNSSRIMHTQLEWRGAREGGSPARPLRIPGVTNH